MSALDAIAQQTLLGVAQQPAGFAAQTAKSILGLHGFQFSSVDCGLPECCQYGQGGNERKQTLQSSDIAVRVYPNPAHSEVNFELSTIDSPALLRIFDLSGNLLWLHKFHSNTVWQAESFPSGLYFYTIGCEGQPILSGKISLLK